MENNVTFKMLKEAIEKAENIYGAKDEDIVYIDVWETLRIVGDHKDILVSPNVEIGEIIFTAN